LLDVQILHRFAEEYDPEATLSSTEDDMLDTTLNITTGEDMDVSSLEDHNNKPQKAESLQERNERLAKEMQNAFNVLAGLGNHNKMCIEHFRRDCVVVDVPLLLKVFNNGCECLTCLGTSQVENSKMEGGVLTISW
jgi:hypothetical protein